ncbi:DUF7065 domain-containing protein [Nocardia miyunensis]|uniref:DUF7065 domain-containing protein n=1 Tax=Nocardia miyunensis TaxID=282684 RepID=UPI000829B691|nr:hypothetical protein [Nocardia miyunensis]
MLTTEFDPSDLEAHEPPDDDARWQESFCIVWHDPATRSGGNHHFSLWRNQRRADIWSWLVLDGVEAGREQVNEIAIPDAGFEDFRVGGMRLRSYGDFGKFRLELDYGTVCAAIDFRAYSPPVELDYARGGASLGKRHIESLGAVDVEVGGRRLSGVAFQDHSWGNRELGRNPAGQFMFAVFGPDLMTSVYLRQTLTGPDQDGWILRNGVLEPVRRATISASVGNDGLFPIRSRCDVWTATGGTRINGVFQTGAVEGGIGLLAGDGLMEFETGGRLGGGMLELKPLRAPLPEHQRILNLP